MNDMSRIEHGEAKPRTEGFSSATNIDKAAHATTINRLKNLVPEKARHALRTSVQKAAVAASGLYLLISSGCGNIESPIVPSPVNEPNPTFAPLVPTPTDDGVTVTIIRAPTREPDTEGVTVKIIPAQTQSPEPTPASPITPTPESTVEAFKAEEIQKEYQSLPLPEEKNINFEKMEFKKIEEILLRFRDSYKGERSNYEDVLLNNNFDSYIIGENHFPYMGQYENVIHMMKKSTLPTIVGLEFINEHLLDDK